MVATRSVKRSQLPDSTVSNTHTNPSKAAQLPVELLAQIFALVSKEWFRKYGKKHNPVIHVCKTWRKVAYGIPDLWLPIDCSKTSAEDSALTSGPLYFPLHLHCSKWKPPSLRVCKGMMDYIERIHEIDILNISSPPIFDALYIDIDRPASELRSLEVAINWSAYPEGKKKPNKLKPMEQMALFMDRDMPRLRELHLNGFSILPWTPERTPSLPSLTSLSLQFYGEKRSVSLSQILPVLSSTPSLEHLLLSLFTLDLENIPDDTIVHLPYLKSLSITSKLYFAALALRPLRFPEKIKLLLTSNDITFNASDIEVTKQAFTACFPEPVTNGSPIVGLNFYITQQEFKFRAYVEGKPWDESVLLKLFSFPATHTSTLYDLATYFVSTFPEVKYVDYGFFRMAPPPPSWDWSGFVTPLTRVESLIIDYTLLSTMHQFVANTCFGHHLPKLKKLGLDFSTNEIFMDSEDDVKRVVGRFYKDLLKQLDAHHALHNTIDVVKFNPIEITTVEVTNLSFLEVFDTDKHFQWEVGAHHTLQGTRAQE